MFGCLILLSTTTGFRWEIQITSFNFTFLSGGLIPYRGIFWESKLWKNSGAGVTVSFSPRKSMQNLQACKELWVKLSIPYLKILRLPIEKPVSDSQTEGYRWSASVDSHDTSRLSPVQCGFTTCNYYNKISNLLTYVLSSLGLETLVLLNLNLEA